MTAVIDWFDDFDAEDAYDAADPIEERIRVVGRVADEVGANPTSERDRTRRRWAIALLVALRVRLDELDDEITDIDRQFGGA